MSEHDKPTQAPTNSNPERAIAEAMMESAKLPEDEIVDRQEAIALKTYFSGPGANLHPDDLAVELFAEAMKKKLSEARMKGRSGWQKYDPTELSIMLREHVEKGDPRDVANFCMFLWSLGKPITALAQPSEATDWPEIMSAVQDADGYVTSATLQVGETITRMVPVEQPSEAQTAELEANLSEQMTAYARCASSRDVLVEEVEALKHDNASMLGSLTKESTARCGAEDLLRAIASLKRSRKNYAGKPSGATATVNIPLNLLEQIDSALSQSTEGKR